MSKPHAGGEPGSAAPGPFAPGRKPLARHVRSGLTPLVTAVESGAVAPSEIERAFGFAYARWWSDRVVSDDPILRRFLPERHENAILRFRDMDARVTELSKRIVRSRLGSGIPGPTAFGADPEWGTLAGQLVKKRNHMPLRQLFGRMPTALTKLTPCVMMSPLSIAQYLPPESTPFDVVIFDEASQIAPWDAIGAIARGRQVVVVGDPEQLPPTNVGDRGVDDIEDGTDVTDQESILDECLAANIPRRNLDWHYRSRHESLIAFSNAHYYGGRLVTFPSPVTQDRAVRLVHVPDGVYERGSSNRVNRPEARAVVTEIVRRLKEPAFAAERRSLGIVTFNADQQRLIENLLDAERRAHPELESFFDKEARHEPVFVKNLENVQGDERDVIVFSVAVGPDAAGRVSTTVSSLNKQGGHRRLNVAITRARRELVVFASLRPEQIDLGRTGSRGVRDFKHFLEFADRGSRALAQAAAPTGQDTESPFEDAVLAGLVDRGWVVHPQVGVSGFRIDLGVVHPDEPGRYLAGGGVRWRHLSSLRDRQRSRPAPRDGADRARLAHPPRLEHRVVVRRRGGARQAGHDAEGRSGGGSAPRAGGANGRSGRDPERGGRSGRLGRNRRGSLGLGWLRRGRARQRTRCFDNAGRGAGGAGRAAHTPVCRPPRAAMGGSGAGGSGERGGALPGRGSGRVRPCPRSGSILRAVVPASPCGCRGACA